MSNEYVKRRLRELGVDQGRAAQARRRRQVYDQGVEIPQACECCGRDPRAARRGNESLCLDHDHVTGRFRGWLCHNCNLGIGLLGDGELGLERALRYLRRQVEEPPKPSKRLAGMLDSVNKLASK